MVKTDDAGVNTIISKILGLLLLKKKEKKRQDLLHGQDIKC